MANPYFKTETGQILTGRGILEIFSLAGVENATAIIYDGTDSNGKRLWDLKCPANDYKDTPILNLSFKTGLYCVLTGSSTVGVTIR
ncbi:MAG: hypothetical protein WC543_06600 [Candidatus Omnitrophota bacterium]